MQTRNRSGVSVASVLMVLLIGTVVVGAAAYISFSRFLPAAGTEELAELEAESPLSVADQALCAGDWRVAEEAYADAAAQGAGSRAEAGWARALLFQYRFADAIGHARRAVELGAREAAAHAVLAQTLNWSGDLDGAASAARRAIDLDAGLAEGHAFLAETFADRYQLADARREVERALTLDPTGVEPLRVRAYLLETEARYDDAVEAYLAAIDSAPRYAHLHFALGNVYRAMGRLDEAADSYRTAANLAPSDARPIAGLGLVSAAQEDLSGAISYFEQAAALDPVYSTPHGQLGTSYYLQGDFARAQEPLARAVELERDRSRLSTYRHVLGWTYFRTGDIDAAEAQFQGALALNPTLDGARQGLEAVGARRHAFAQ